MLRTVFNRSAALSRERVGLIRTSGLCTLCILLSSILRCAVVPLVLLPHFLVLLTAALRRLALTPLYPSRYFLLALQLASRSGRVSHLVVRQTLNLERASFCAAAGEFDSSRFLMKSPRHGSKGGVEPRQIE